MSKKLVIHAGGVFPNPLLNREGAASAAFMAGSVVVFDSGKMSLSVDGTDAAIKYIADRDYLRCKGVDDSYVEGDNVIGIHPISGMFLNVAAAAGDYKKGDALKIASGRVTAGGDADSIFYAEETITIATAGDLLRVVVK